MQGLWLLVRTDLKNLPVFVARHQGHLFNGEARLKETVWAFIAQPVKIWLPDGQLFRTREQVARRVTAPVASTG